jgi:transposase
VAVLSVVKWSQRARRTGSVAGEDRRVPHAILGADRVHPHAAQESAGHDTLLSAVQRLTREIEGLAARDDRARRLMTIPGIGPLAATALLAAIGDGRQFRRSRDLVT